MYQYKPYLSSTIKVTTLLDSSLDHIWEALILINFETIEKNKIFILFEGLKKYICLLLWLLTSEYKYFLRKGEIRSTNGWKHCRSWYQIPVRYKKLNSRTPFSLVDRFTLFFPPHIIEGWPDRSWTDRQGVGAWRGDRIHEAITNSSPDDEKLTPPPDDDDDDAHDHHATTASDVHDGGPDGHGNGSHGHQFH